MFDHKITLKVGKTVSKLFKGRIPYWLLVDRTKMCPTCHKKFLYERKEQKYCSNKCWTSTEKAKLHLKKIGIKSYQIQSKNRIKPNFLENKIIIILKNISKGWKYNQHFHGKFPDFINYKKKKVIDLFGNHWHTKNEVNERIKFFRKYGYDCYIIWGKDVAKCNKTGNWSVLILKIMMFIES